MTDGSVVIDAKMDFAQMTSDINGLKGMLQDALKGVQDSVDQIASSTASTATQATNQAMMQVATVISDAMSGAAQAVWNAGVEFESAFAGVKKTVDTSAEGFAHLQDAVTEMSERIPVSASELSRIMELGGQLGIQFDNLSAFTETIAALAVSTDLTAEAAASMFAQFANVTHMPQAEFSNLGASLVDLGNNFATTESAIMEMSQRLAPFGTLVKISQSDLLAWGTAMSSVGIEAEAGGTAMTKIWQEMESASTKGTEAIQMANEMGTSLRDLETMANWDSDGFKGLAMSLGMTTTELKDLVEAGKGLESFAEVAGMTAEEFAQSFGEDATGATIAFLEGLKGIDEAGGSVSGTLSKMGMKEVRVQRALMSLANASDLVGQAVDVSNKAFKENVALTEEAGKRYETTESKVAMIKNTLQNVAASIFNTLKPAIDAVLSGIQGLVKWFGDLSPAAQLALAALLGLAGAVAAVAAALPTLSVLFTGLVAIFTGPLGLAIGIAAATAALIAFVGVPIANALRDAELSRINAAFGDIKLSADAVAEAVAASYKPNVDISSVTTAVTEIESLNSTIADLDKSITNTLWEVSVGVTLTAAEQKTLKEQVSSLVAAGQALVNAEHEKIDALVDVFWQKSETADDVSAFQAAVAEFATPANLLPAKAPEVPAPVDVKTDVGTVSKSENWDKRLETEMTAEKLIPPERRGINFSTKVDLTTDLEKISTSSVESTLGTYFERNKYIQLGKEGEDGSRVLVAKSAVDLELDGVTAENFVKQYAELSVDEVKAKLETKSVEKGVALSWKVETGYSDEGVKGKEHHLVKGIELLQPQKDVEAALEGKDLSAEVKVPITEEVDSDNISVGDSFNGIDETVKADVKTALEEKDLTVKVDVPVAADLPDGAMDLSELIEKVQAAVTNLGATMEAKGKQLRQAMDAGLADGVLDAGEAAVIARLKDEYVQLTQRLSGVEMQVELQKVRLDASRMTLSRESFGDIKKRIDELVDKDLSELDLAKELLVEETLKAAVIEEWSTAEIDAALLTIDAGMEARIAQVQEQKELSYYVALTPTIAKVSMDAFEDSVQTLFDNMEWMLEGVSKEELSLAFKLNIQNNFNEISAGVIYDLKQLTHATDEELQGFANTFEKRKPELEARFHAYIEAGIKPPDDLIAELNNGTLIEAMTKGYDNLTKAQQGALQSLADSGELTAETLIGVFQSAAAGLLNDTTLVDAYTQKFDELLPALENVAPGLGSALEKLGIDLGEKAGETIPPNIVNKIVEGMANGSLDVGDAAGLLAEALGLSMDEILGLEQEFSAKQAELSEEQIAEAKRKAEEIAKAEDELVLSIGSALNKYVEVANEGMRKLKDESKVSLSEFTSNMADNAKLLEQRTDNLEKIAARTQNLDFLRWIRSLADEEPAMIAKIAASTPKEFAKLEAQWKAGVNATTDAIILEIKSEAAALAAQGSMWGSGLGVSIQTALLQAGRDVDEYKPALMSALESLGVSAGDVLGAALPQGFIDGISKGLADGTMTVETAARQIATHLAKPTEATAAGAETGAAGASGTEAGLTQGTPAVQTAEQALIAAATPSEEQKQALVTEGTTAGAGLTDAFYAAIEAGGAKISTVTQTICDGVINTFITTITAEQGTSVGTAFMAALTAAVSSVGAGTVSATLSISTGVKDAAANTLAYSVSYTIGTQFGQGLAGGIESMSSAIADAARSAARSAFVAAKQALEINSPSRKMLWVGQMADQGMAEGLLRGIPGIEAAASRASEAAMINSSRAELAGWERAMALSSAAARDAGGGAGAVSVGDIIINAENANTDQDWRSIGQILGEEVARRNRYRGVVTI